LALITTCESTAEALQVQSAQVVAISHKAVVAGYVVRLVVIPGLEKISYLLPPFATALHQSLSPLLAKLVAFSKATETS